MNSKSNSLGGALTLVASLTAGLGLLTGHLPQYMAVGIAIIGIVFGSALTRGLERRSR